jgi:hypothetical protein
MQVLTDREAAAWCAEWGRWVKPGADGVPDERAPGLHKVEIRLPERSTEIVLLARALCMLPEEEETSFSGALLWLTGFDIGSVDIEKVGWRILECMRRGFGDHRSLEIAAAHAFRADEFVEASAFLSQVMFFKWDAYFLPPSRNFFVFVSHEEIVQVIANSGEALGDLALKLAPWDPAALSPRQK